MPLPYGETEIRRAYELGSREHEILSRLLDSVGNGTGTKNMAGAADEYLIKPPAGEIFLIDQIIVTIEDGAAIDVDGWGALVALTNGCLFRVRRQEAASPVVTVKDLADGTPFKSNIQLGRLGELYIFSSMTGCLIQAKLKIPTIRLDGQRGESLSFETQDDLSGLTRQEVAVLGFVCQSLT